MRLRSGRLPLVLPDGGAPEKAQDKEPTMIGRVILAAAVGLAFGGVAGGFGYYLGGLLNPTQPPVELRPFFVLTPAISAALAAAIAWWWIVIRPGGPGVLRGLIAGTVGVMSSYVVFAVLASVFLYGIQFFPWLLFLPPLATGWLTLPIGALLGAALGGVQRWLSGPQSAADRIATCPTCPASGAG